MIQFHVRAEGDLDDALYAAGDRFLNLLGGIRIVVVDDGIRAGFAGEIRLLRTAGGCDDPRG